MNAETVKGRGDLIEFDHSVKAPSLLETIRRKIDIRPVSEGKSAEQAIPMITMRVCRIEAIHSVRINSIS